MKKTKGKDSKLNDREDDERGRITIIIIIILSSSISYSSTAVQQSVRRTYIASSGITIIVIVWPLYINSCLVLVASSY